MTHKADDCKKNKRVFERRLASKTSIGGPWFPVNGVIKLPGWSGVGVSEVRCPEGTAVVA